MNETRKKIIELISDYMDKTLNFGCIISLLDGRIYSILSYEKDEITGTSISAYAYYNGSNYVREIKSQNEYKIIGHYDITAVLKYIFYNDVNTTNSGEYIAFYGVKLKRIEYKIPNKPIHLYTEEEEKKLLELLLKIKD